jgi:nucleoside-diphosphate-sugar epimerase
MPIPEFSGVAVLVTGGAGFIGSHLTAALVAHGARVRVLDDLSTGKRSNLEAVAAEVDWREGDIRDADCCRRAVAGVRFVFHQAARSSVPGSFADPATTRDVNAGGTGVLLDAAHAAGVERTVWASSSAVYGDSRQVPAREDRRGTPLSPYAESKLAAELLSTERAARGQEIVALRYFNVYGPRQDPNGPYAAVVPRFLSALAAGSAPVIYGDGEQTRDFLFVADAVHANLLAAGAPPAAAHAGAYNVASGRATRIRDLAVLAAEVLGVRLSPTFAPAREGEVLHSLGDPSRFLREIGELVPTPLAVGLAVCARALGT